MENTQIFFSEIIVDDKHDGIYSNHLKLKEFTNIFIA